METTTQITIPTKFYDDHVSRGLGGGIVIKSGVKLSTVEINYADLCDLLGDANYYIELYDDKEIRQAGEADLGLQGSAKSTKRRIEAHVAEHGWPEEIVLTAEEIAIKEAEYKADQEHLQKVRLYLDAKFDARKVAREAFMKDMYFHEKNEWLSDRDLQAAWKEEFDVKFDAEWEGEIP